jgi:hypothetical protein
MLCTCMCFQLALRIRAQKDSTAGIYDARCPTCLGGENWSLMRQNLGDRNTYSQLMYAVQVRILTSRYILAGAGES